MNIPVRVTAEHIRNGQRFLSKQCPIALAIKQALSPVTVTDSLTTIVQVGVLSVRLMRLIGVTKGGHPIRTCVHAPLTERMSRFVDDFDYTRGHIHPFSFTMHLSDKVLTRFFSAESIAALKARYGD